MRIFVCEVVMARRRRVNNLLGLAVLSVVVPRPMHPYEMASALRAHGKEQDIEIKWGSLYRVVRNLEMHGLLAVVGTHRRGRRPERTVYRITDEGRAELEDWVAELLGTPAREYPSFKAALSLLSVLTPESAIALLRQRLDLLAGRIAETRDALANYRHEVPRLFLVEVEYELQMTEAEAKWTRALLEELSAGMFPDLAAWQAWHESGEVPPGLAELAERGVAQD
jgi:DNA-binding PadR family transcriptional regulator